MKRFIKEYAQDIEKEIARRLAILDDPRKMSVYNRAAVEAASDKLKNIMLYADHDMLTVSDTMLELVKCDPRNNGRL